MVGVHWVILLACAVGGYAAVKAFHTTEDRACGAILGFSAIVLLGFSADLIQFGVSA